MKFNPATEPNPLPYDPFKSCTVPRPIGWLSTISRDGHANLAPFSQWQNMTFDPPMVLFAANRYPDGRHKDTVLNAEETGYFVWNMATWDLREAVNKSAMFVEPDVDEFDLAGVTKAECEIAPGPRVLESPAHFECEYISTQSFRGDSNHGYVDVVFGRVVQIHVADDVITADGKLDIPKIQPIARLGYYDYAVIRETFEMKIPDAGEMALAGLEGRSSPSL